MTALNVGPLTPALLRRGDEIWIEGEYEVPILATVQEVVDVGAANTHVTIAIPRGAVIGYVGRYEEKT